MPSDAPPFCVICAICERIDSISRKPQKKIINLNNQINLSKTHAMVIRAYSNTPGTRSEDVPLEMANHA